MKSNHKSQPRQPRSPRIHTQPTYPSLPTLPSQPSNAPAPPAPTRPSQQSTTEHTFTDYYGENMKNLLTKVRKSQQRISKSREKVQVYLSNLVKTPTKKEMKQSRQTRRSGQIVNQTENLTEYLRHRSEENDIRGKIRRVHRRYMLNQEIIRVLIDSIEEERKSNRIFEKQLQIKILLLSQLHKR